MKSRFLIPAIAGATTLLSACASMDGGAGGTAAAPQPAKSIDVAKFYTGRWYEIARTPMNLTKGCVAGTTDYGPNPDGGILDTDACRMDTPDGKVKTFAGPVTILDPGQNNKVKVDYKVAGVIPVARTYWMLDHGDDYGWFIVSNPAFTEVSIFTRAPRPDQGEVDRLTARVKALGYDPGKLEYPAQFPPGQS